MSRGKKTDLIESKEQHIVLAALSVFSQYGLQGASMEKIAEVAGVSKSNLFYYFKNKEHLYIEVLSYVLTEWLEPLNYFSEQSDPRQVLESYIELKYEMSKKNPQASRLYALEMIQGSPYLMKVLKTALKPLVMKKVQIIEYWIAQKKIKPVSPIHLIFHIWAVTQHYADFATQVQVVTGKTLSNKAFKQEAIATTKQLLLGSVLLFDAEH
ncbi:TetR family transcriptional regulator C-terminal domain-containing protein [Acinetobacter rathckeae]|uniref:TetR family transcriptional regulator C-terminal domain-containing protein n=1 Tax=Acinetobacter rathckeae TaxID=2605272 RepID=UPI0018A2BD9D|nr:TetR family transcriptional regulator C-terminal domain-containing protein [Acinetobacter rathckeae]MBF7688130.1 TetR family transcriptional regulator C-terminal domain-containing protein [Acinetobacter rathckeae]MBF7695359.1 TetR family transcriptional regulator C-terminal domain-containing protein [Acinetobacter rathckeae]